MQTLEPEIAATFRAGSLTALGRVAEQYQASLYRLGWRMFANRHAAEDFVQDALLHAFAKRHRYDPRRPFAPWFYKVALNLARQKLRRRREYPAGDGLPETPMEPRADTDLERGEEQERVRRALAAVPATFREGLALRFETDMPLHEMARVMGLPMGTVKSRLNRGLKLFAKAYRATGG